MWRIVRSYRPPTVLKKSARPKQLCFTYGTDLQTFGGPAWTESEAFDVEAKENEANERWARWPHRDRQNWTNGKV
jgi:hypothetical protein